MRERERDAGRESERDAGREREKWEKILFIDSLTSFFPSLSCSLSLFSISPFLYLFNFPLSLFPPLSSYNIPLSLSPSLSLSLFLSLSAKKGFFTFGLWWCLTHRHTYTHTHTCTHTHTQNTPTRQA